MGIKQEQMKRFGKIRQILESERFIYGVAAVGVVLRMIMWVAIARHPLFSDAAGYHEMALHFSRGENFSPFWPPGLPFFLSIAYRIFGISTLTARGSVILIYLLFTWAAYSLGKALSGTLAGNLAALIFCFYPAYVYHSVEPLSELPAAACLVAISFFCISVWKQSRMGNCMALGIFLGLLALVRPSSSLLLAVIPATLAMSKRALKPALITGCVSVLVLGVWIVKAYEMTGHIVPINGANSLNVFLGNNPYTPLYKTWWLGTHGAEPGTPAQYSALLESIKANAPEVRDRLYSRIAIHYILSRPDLFAIRTLNRFRTYFAFEIFAGACLMKNYQWNRLLAEGILTIDASFYCIIMILAILLFFSRVPIEPEILWLMFGITVLYSVPYWVVYSHPEYHFPVMAIFGVLAAVEGAELIFHPWKEVLAPVIAESRKRKLLYVVLILFVYIQMEWTVAMIDRI